MKDVEVDQHSRFGIPQIGNAGAVFLILGGCSSLKVMGVTLKRQYVSFLRLHHLCECSSMVERKLPKLKTGVQFSSLAQTKYWRASHAKS